MTLKIKLLSLLYASLFCSANHSLLAQQALTAQQAHQQASQDFTHYLKKCAPKKNGALYWPCLAKLFQGRPYQFDPMGDQTQDLFDSRPMLNTTEFDCMTHTNTLLALFHAENFQEFTQHLIRLRYQSATVSHYNRHHFMSSEWLPSNQKKGYIYDITSTLKDAQGKKLAETITTTIQYPHWYRYQKKHRAPLNLSQKLRLTYHQYTSRPQRTSLEHIPLSKLFLADGQVNFNIIQQIPDASIVLFTCPHWAIEHKIGTRINIAHLGFVYRKNQQLMFLHASPDTKKVTEMLLSDYLIRARDKIRFLEGIHIEKIQHNPL